MATDGSDGAVDGSEHEDTQIEVAPLGECRVEADFLGPTSLGEYLGATVMPCYLWGDGIVDHWVTLEPVRLSQEAACMIMEVREEWCDEGGASNLWRCLQSIGIAPVCICTHGGSKKERFMARGHQIFRIDDDTQTPADVRSDTAARLVAEALETADHSMLIISDYGKGAVLTPDDDEALQAVLALNWHTVVFDPYPSNIVRAERALYYGAAPRVVIKANIGEFAELDPDGRDVYERADLPEVATRIAEKRPHMAGIHWVVTCGRRGVVLVPEYGSLEDDGCAYYAPGFPCRVVHSIGAGDAFMAGLCAALVHRHTLAGATYFAHLVAQTSVEMEYCGRPTLKQVLAYDSWRKQMEAH